MSSAPPNKVLVWQSQFVANDFPPVCAMTGAQAETWTRFTFTKTPPWAIWVGGLLLRAMLAERVTGYLPLTRASASRLQRMRWILAGVIALGFVLILVSFALANSNGAAFFIVFIGGIAVMLGGLIGLSIARSTVGPAGKLLDVQPGYNQRLIELRNLHPAFVAAVQELQHMRAQQAYPK